jgi:hypothetical protein
VTGAQPLAGGNLSTGIVRVGNRVHRPAGPWTPAVHALLQHLEAAGFDGAPRVFGFDDRGREVIEFINGPVPWPDDQHRLLGPGVAVRRLGRLLRSFHDAVETFRPDQGAVWRFPEMADDGRPFADDRGFIVCHNDPAAWNLVVGEERWAFIDWDAAGPRPPIWDVAYCAASVIPVWPDSGRAGWTEPVARRLSALADGYGLSRPDLERLPHVMAARLRSSYLHLRHRAEAGIAPWDTLWRNGHGETWAGALQLVEANARRWSKELRSSD